MSGYPNQYPQVPPSNQPPPQGYYQQPQGYYPQSQQQPQGYFQPPQGYYLPPNGNTGYVPLAPGTVVVAVNPHQFAELRLRRLTISLAVATLLFCAVFAGVSLASPSSIFYWGDYFSANSPVTDFYFGLKQVNVCINGNCQSSDLPSGSDCYNAGNRSYSMNVAAIVFSFICLLSLVFLYKGRPRLGAGLVVFFSLVSSVLMLCAAVTWGKDCFSAYEDIANNSSFTLASRGVQYILVMIGGVGGLVYCVLMGLFLACYGAAATPANASLAQPMVA